MIAQAASDSLQLVPDWPTIAIVLGSAQAAFVNSLSNTGNRLQGHSRMARPSVPGHAGKFIIGDCGGRRICVLAGRVHLYEGWTPQQVTFGIRVLGSLGMKTSVSHQRRRRHQPDLPLRAARLHHRSHQSAGPESAHRAE